MSASAWENLSELMAVVAMFADLLKWAMLAVVLLAMVIWLGVWLLKIFVHFSGYGPGLTAGESSQSSLLDRFDERAGIAISRRPRRRKRRHRHHA